MESGDAVDLFVDPMGICSSKPGEAEMRARDVAIIASRLLGIYFALGAAYWIGNLLGFTGLSARTFAIFGLPALAYLTAGAFLWFKAESVGTSVARGSSNEGTISNERTTTQDVLLVGCALLGIYFAARAITGLATSIGELANEQRLIPGFNPALRRDLWHMGASAVEGSIGAVLVAARVRLSEHLASSGGAQRGV